MEKIETSYYIISLVSAILSGLISSYIWSWITRKLCFPQLEIDERVYALYGLTEEERKVIEG